MSYKPRHAEPSAAARASKVARAAVAGGAAAGVAVTAAVAGVPAAFAAPLPPAGFTAVTHVVNNYDDGGNGFWSVDDETRTLTVSVAASQAGVPEGDTAFTAAIKDHGTWNAIAGAFTPNQAGAAAGEKITRSEDGTFTGSASYSFTAPSADVPSAANVAKYVNDNFTKPASGPDSAGQWYLQAFTAAQQPAVTGSIGDDWTWAYGDACQSWTDSAANGDGQGSADGNITGKACVFPYTYDGRPSYVAPTRESITFKENTGTWVEFTIRGTGPINGHHGWVDAQGGGALNAGVYTGLEAGHGYGVTYTPVTGRGSLQRIPGSHGGTAFFVSGTPSA